MQELEKMINIYHTAFIVFLILTIVFLVVSIVLFFVFNIPSIFDMKTGRGAKRKIREMKELNDQTGKLRQDVAANTPVRLAAEERISAPPTEKRRNVFHDQERPAQNVQTQASSYQEKSQANIDSYSEGSQETTLLSEGSQETMLLSEQGTTLLDTYNEITILSSDQTMDIPQSEQKKLPGAFKIDKEIIWIHTEEML